MWEREIRTFRKVNNRRIASKARRRPMPEPDHHADMPLLFAQKGKADLPDGS